MQLFYHPGITRDQPTIAFPKEESRHIVKVLRKGPGEVLEVTNGKGTFFSTKILEAGPNRCTAAVISSRTPQQPSWNLHMAVAPTKMNDRYEWFLEKATEIGLQEVTPVFCDHSERKVVKLNRFERVLQSAMKQSLQCHLPVLHSPQALSDFITADHPGQKFIAHCEQGQPRHSLKEKIPPASPVTILIGPEGDFSPEEIRLALENGWQPVVLGANRLRTETAAIVATHTVALANE